MTTLLRQISRPRAVVLVVVLLLVVGLVTAFRGGQSTRTVTAHFSQAVSIYKGSDVDIMGVRVGKVLSVTPQGQSVRVVMEYDAKYRLPAQVKAAIVTPTLVADRFVQLAPAYTGGKTLPDKGDIPMSRTAVPVEMDQIYKSLADLTDALGPNGANKSGALNDLLASSAKALKGNGQGGHEMIANLSAAAQTLSKNSPQLFDTLDSLAQITQTLADNDDTVQSFMTHLAKVSQQLSGESGDLQQALSAIADAVSVTRGFVHDNKDALVGDIKQLTETLNVLAQQKDSLATTLQLAPLGLGNLADSFDTITGTEGIRLQLGPTGSDLPGILCALVTNDKVPNAGTVCDLFKALIPNSLTSSVGAGLTNLGVPSLVTNGTSSLSSLASQVQSMVGGATKGAKK